MSRIPHPTRHHQNGTPVDEATLDALDGNDDLLIPAPPHGTYTITLTRVDNTETVQFTVNVTPAALDLRGTRNSVLEWAIETHTTRAGFIDRAELRNVGLYLNPHGTEGETYLMIHGPRIHSKGTITRKGAA